MTIDRVELINQRKNVVSGLGALPASFIFGLLWKEFGYFTAFTTGSVLAAVSMIIVIFIRKSR